MKNQPSFVRQGGFLLKFVWERARKLGRERARPWRRRACCMPFPFSYQAAKTAASVPGGMQSSFKEGQFSIPLPPVKPDDQEQER